MAAFDQRAVTPVIPETPANAVRTGAACGGLPTTTTGCPAPAGKCA